MPALVSSLSDYHWPGVSVCRIVSTMKTEACSFDRRRAVGLELYKDAYYLCVVDLDTGNRKFCRGSLNVSTWPGRLSARIVAGDIILLLDDHFLCKDAVALLQSKKDVAVIIENFNGLGDVWRKVGVVRGRATARSLADCLLSFVVNCRHSGHARSSGDTQASDDTSDIIIRNNRTGDEPDEQTRADGGANDKMDNGRAGGKKETGSSVGKQTKPSSSAKKVLQLGLYLKELAHRSDAVLKNLDNLMDGRKLDATVEKALKLEIAYRRPLTAEGMKIPDTLLESLLPPMPEVDDGSFLSEYVQDLKK